MTDPRPSLLSRILSAVGLARAPELATPGPEGRLLGGVRARSRYADTGYRAIYPRGMQALSRVTGVPSAAPPVSDLLSLPVAPTYDGQTNLSGIPVGEHNWALRPLRWRGTSGRPGVQDQIRREDPAVQRVALMWEGPASQEGDWTVETEHEGAEAEAIRASVEDALRCVRSGVGFGVVRGLLAHALATPWRGFTLSRWSYQLGTERAPSGALHATLAIGRPIMPWAVQRWDRGARGGWDPTLLSTAGSLAGGPVRLPADELLHVTFGASDHPEGLGLLRAMWSRYDARALFLVLERMGFDRAAVGVPVAYYPPEMIQPDVDAVQAVLANLRSRQHAETTIPEGVRIEFLEFPFRAEEISAAIKQGADEILAAALCGPDDDEHRLPLIQANADACADEVNRKIIPALVEYNFGPDALALLPRMRAPRIPLMEPTKFVESVRKGIRSGAITATADIEATSRRVLGLEPMPDELLAAYREIAPVPSVGKGSAQEAGDRADAQPADPDDDVEPAPIDEGADEEDRPNRQ